MLSPSHFHVASEAHTFSLAHAQGSSPEERPPDVSVPLDISSAEAAEAQIFDLYESLDKRLHRQLVLCSGSPAAPFAPIATAEEVSRLVCALRAFPSEPSVVRTACEAIMHCLEGPKGCNNAAELVEAGAAEALLECTRHRIPPHGVSPHVWVAASALARDCPDGKVPRLVQAGWADAALRNLSDGAAPPPLVMHGVRILARCVICDMSCAGNLLRGGAVKARGNSVLFPSDERWRVPGLRRRLKKWRSHTRAPPQALLNALPAIKLVPGSEQRDSDDVVMALALILQPTSLGLPREEAAPILPDAMAFIEAGGVEAVCGLLREGAGRALLQRHGFGLLHRVVFTVWNAGADTAVLWRTLGRLNDAGALPAAVAALRAHGAVPGDEISREIAGWAGEAVVNLIEDLRPLDVDTHISTSMLGAVQLAARAGAMEAAAAAMWAHLRTMHGPTIHACLNIICPCLTVGWNPMFAALWDPDRAEYQRRAPAAARIEGRPTRPPRSLMPPTSHSLGEAD